MHPGRTLFAAPLLLAACAILAVRALLGFQFPVPWPDETGFVAPAFDFARTGSFFDPGLNPDRVVMWMPPGYMLLLAALFRVAGYSYALARWVSTIACLISLALAASLAWRLCAGWRRVAAASAVAIAFATPFMLIDTNVARMEMPFAAVILLALRATTAGRPFVAAACVAAAGLIHVNAIYFVPPVAIAFIAGARHRQFPRPGAADCLAMTAAALAWAAYAVDIARNWPGFQADMAMQFALKEFIANNDPAHPLWPMLAAAALAAAALLSRRRFDPALFGLAFLVQAHNGHELWYDYGQPLGFALIAVALLATPPTSTSRDIPLAAAAIILSAVIGWRITDALRPLLPHPAMLHRDVVPAADIARVRRFIATLPPGTTVDFGWTGMELFFLDDLARAGAHWTILRHSVTQVWPLRRADWRVVCDSTEFPAFLFKFDIGHPRQGADTGCEIVRP